MLDVCPFRIGQGLWCERNDCVNPECRGFQLLRAHLTEADLLELRSTGRIIVGSWHVYFSQLVERDGCRAHCFFLMDPRYGQLSHPHRRHSILPWSDAFLTAILMLRAGVDLHDYLRQHEAKYYL